jgi:hypothetical protein
VSLFDDLAPPREKPRKTKLEDLPRHVKAKLEAAGAADFSGKGPPAIARAMRIDCPGCGRTVVRGLLPMPTPWPVDVDSRALSRESEVLALLANRRTYNLAWRQDRYELTARTSWDFSLKVLPAKSDIVATHICGQPGEWPGTRSVLPPLKVFTTVISGDDPPY